MSLQDFINKHVEIVAVIEKASRLAWWNLATTGDLIYAQQYEEANITLRKIYSSSEEYKFLRSHQHHPEPLLNRQVTLLLQKYLENQISPEKIQEIVKLETEIEGIYTNFRPLIGNQLVSNNDLKEILLKSHDSKKRQEAWEASKQIGEQVKQKVLNLIQLRNASARDVGFHDFYSLQLHLQELEESQLFDLIERLNQLTLPSWEKYKSKLDQHLAKRFQISSDDLMPWHYQDPFFQEAPKQDDDFDSFYKGKDLIEISRFFYESIGLSIEDILNRSDLFEREKKNQHAFCTCIDRKQDIRILCNLRDNEYWMSTQLHELGHAIYDQYIDQKLPYLLRQPAHTCTTEAIAMLFGRLSKNGDFLHQFCNVDATTAQRLSSYSQLQNAAHLLVFARWCLVMIHFERAMYQQPEADLNTLWWDCVEKFQWVKRIPGRNQADWAAKLHLACAPVYYQNYILGEMTASQLLHYIYKITNKKSLASLEVGTLLKDKLFCLGSQLPWDKTLYHVTNELLNPNYLVQDIRE